MLERQPEIVVAPIKQRRKLGHLLPPDLPARGILAVAVAAELRQYLCNTDAALAPGVLGEMAQKQRIGVACFRPKDVTCAERIVLDNLLPLFDQRIIRADIERRFKCEKHRERVREFAHKSPLGKIVLFTHHFGAVIARRVTFVIPDDVPLRIERLDERLHFFREPGEIEVPAGEEDFRLGIIPVGAREEPVEREKLESEVVGAVGVAEPLAETDRMEKPRPGPVVFAHGGFRELPVFIDPFVVANVKAGDITVVLNNGINFYGIRYDAIEGSAAEPVNKVWDFSATEWVDAMTGSGIAANTNDSNWDLEVDGLRVVSGGGSIKWNVSGETYYWQPGGAGTDSKRYFEFTTEMAGKLTVYASNTGSSEDLTRMVTVKVGDGAEESLPGGYSSSNGAVPVEFNITAGTVKVYATGNGLRFYKIEFHSN